MGRRHGQVASIGVEALVRGAKMTELRDLVARVLEEVGVPVAAGVSLSQGMKLLMRILGDS